MDFGYTYDNAGNVKISTDYTPGARQTRSMTYDALDRPMATTSPMFTAANYTYDVLDNLKSVKVIGGNQVRGHAYTYDTNQHPYNPNPTGGTPQRGAPEPLTEPLQLQR